MDISSQNLIENFLIENFYEIEVVDKTWTNCPQERSNIQMRYNRDRQTDSKSADKNNDNNK